MPVIKQRIPWTKQPQYPVRIDWSNPICRGLVSAITGIQGDIFKPSAPTILGIGSINPLLYGVAIKSVYTGGGVANEVIYPVNFSASGNRTLAVLASNIGGLNGFITHIVNDADSVDALRIGATSFQATLDNNTTSQVAITESSVPRLYVARRRSNQASAYANGTFTDESVTGTRTLDATTFIFGRGSESSVPSQTYLSMYWTRYLSNPEIIALEKNPWQIFAP